MNFNYTDPIVIRQAREADTGNLDRLAALDSAKLSKGPFLIAEVDGQARAAVAINDGSAVADPFFPSAQLVDLMRVRLTPQAPRSERRGSSPAFAPPRRWGASHDHLAPRRTRPEPQRGLRAEGVPAGGLGSESASSATHPAPHPAAAHAGCALPNLLTAGH